MEHPFQGPQSRAFFSLCPRPSTAPGLCSLRSCCLGLHHPESQKHAALL